MDSFIYDISDARMLYFVQFNPQRSTSLRKRRYGAVVSVYDKSDAERNIGFSNSLVAARGCEIEARIMHQVSELDFPSCSVARGGRYRSKIPDTRT